VSFSIAPGGGFGNSQAAQLILGRSPRAAMNGCGFLMGAPRPDGDAYFACWKINVRISNSALHVSGFIKASNEPSLSVLKST
jgi:hypothetical protein